VVAEATPDLTPVDLPAVRSSRRRTWLVVITMVVIIGFLLGQGMLSSLNYFKTTDEALAQRASIGTRVIRLEGTVTPHSIARTSRGADFTLEASHHRVVVVHESGTPPQLFRGNLPVVVVGHFVTAHSMVFVANQIIVKHTASYIAQYPNRVTAPDGSKR
jgi:cytochrome c-type biogenesis protein CcmE